MGALEVTVSALATPGDPGARDLQPAEHYRQALLLGAGAPVEFGLALLARDAGRQAEAATRIPRRPAHPKGPRPRPPGPRPAERLWHRPPAIGRWR